MPILEIEMVTGDGETLDASLASKLADATAEVFATEAGRTWVRLRQLPRSSYAENGGGPPEGTSPVFVSVLLADPPEGQDLRLQIQRLTRAIAEACGRPTESVHLLYQQAARGRVAFGGELVPGHEA